MLESAKTSATEIPQGSAPEIAKEGTWSFDAMTDWVSGLFREEPTWGEINATLKQGDFRNAWNEMMQKDFGLLPDTGDFLVMGISGYFGAKIAKTLNFGTKGTLATVGTGAVLGYMNPLTTVGIGVIFLITKIISKIAPHLLPLFIKKFFP